MGQIFVRTKFFSGLSPKKYRKKRGIAKRKNMWEKKEVEVPARNMHVRSRKRKERILFCWSHSLEYLFKKERRKTDLGDCKLRIVNRKIFSKQFREFLLREMLSTILPIFESNKFVNFT